ncbi:hypothetical protein M5689_010916 [Euphorbia peplus]|nr:hypothetical protein M5689_010916 [Euphorbia peplus]
MMKPIVFVSCLVLLLSLSVPTFAQGAKQCLQVDTFIGAGCPPASCVEDFLAKYGASAMPQNCKCSPNGANQRTCSCLIFSYNCK